MINHTTPAPPAPGSLSARVADLAAALADVPPSERPALSSIERSLLSSFGFAGVLS